jgi:hypothetical protein
LRIRHRPAEKKHRRRQLDKPFTPGSPGLRPKSFTPPLPAPCQPILPPHPIPNSNRPCWPRLANPPAPLVRAACGGAYRGLRPAHEAPGRYSRRLTTAAGARGHFIPRARGADFPPPRSPAAAKPTLLIGCGRLLLPGGKSLHPTDMASQHNKGGRIRGTPAIDRWRPVTVSAPAAPNKAAPPRAAGSRHCSE